MAKKKLKKQNNEQIKNFFKKYFLLDHKRILLLVLLWFVSVILHNFISDILKYFYPNWQGDGAVFFIIAIFIIPLYFLVSLIYTIVYMFKNKSYSLRLFFGVIASFILGILLSCFLILIGFLNKKGFYISMIFFTALAYPLIKFIFSEK